MSRGYARLKERMREANVLYSALFELTYKCNLDCYFCYNDLGRQGRELDAAEWQRVLGDLRDLGAMEVSLSGGEPLVSRAFWPVARRARELGFVVRVKSNGHVVNATRARRLAEEVQPYKVEVSVHGARAETHERQTRVPGSFERLVENLRTMKEIGLRVELKSTLTRWNEGEMEGIFALADDLGLPLAVDAVVTPRDDGDQSPLAIRASDEGVRNLYRLLFERRQRRGPEGDAGSPESHLEGPGSDSLPAGSGGADPPGTTAKKNCGTGSTTLTIDPYGSVFPCVQWRRPVGNVREASLAEIWGGSPELEEVRRLNREAGAKMSALGEAAPGGFCLGLAEELTGDPLGLYDQIERKGEAYREEKKRSALPILGQDVA